MIEQMNPASQASFHAVQTSIQETRVEFSSMLISKLTI
jgi:hypothetical protein